MTVPREEKKEEENKFEGRKLGTKLFSKSFHSLLQKKTEMSLMHVF